MTPVEVVLLIIALVVGGFCVAASVYSMNRVDAAVKNACAASESAAGSARATEHAAYYRDRLIDLLVELSPSARRAVIASWQQAPVTPLVRVHQPRHDGLSLDREVT